MNSIILLTIYFTLFYYGHIGSNFRYRKKQSETNRQQTDLPLQQFWVYFVNAMALAAWLFCPMPSHHVPGSILLLCLNMKEGYLSLGSIKIPLVWFEVGRGKGRHDACWNPLHISSHLCHLIAASLHSKNQGVFFESIF